MASPMKQFGARARVQHGLVSRRQALAMGVSDDMLCDWTAGGRLERVHAAVYRVAGAPATWEQRAMAAALATGGVVSHLSAARVWGMGEADEKVEVTVERGRRGTAAGVIVHRSRDLVRPHVTKRMGLPVTNPMRTLADMGAVVGKSAVSDALERAVTARVCSVVGVERVLDDVARKGRRGAGVLRRVLDDRALGTARADGLLEARMARVLREHGLPTPVFQHRVRGLGGRLLARVDFAYPDVLVAIEVDGFEVHGTAQALQADLERQNRLVAAGWTVLRFTWLDVVRRPEWVVAQVAAVLRAVSRAA